MHTDCAGRHSCDIAQVGQVLAEDESHETGNAPVHLKVAADP